MLYLVRLDGYLKIGYSTNVANRIKGFMTTSLNVELLATREGELFHEKEMHKLCAEFNLRNELFKDHPTVIELFKNHIFFEYETKYKELMIRYLALMDENKELKENKKIYYKNMSFNEDKTLIIDDLKGNKGNDLEWNQQFVFKLKKINQYYDVNMSINNEYIRIGDSLYYRIKDKAILNQYFSIAKAYTTKSNETIYYYAYQQAISVNDLRRAIDAIKKYYSTKKS